MNALLTTIKTSLTKLVAHVQATVPNDEPFNVAHGNWSFPGITRSELVEQAQSIITLIDERGTDEIPEGEARLKDYGRRLDVLRNQTVPQLWGNAGQAVSAYVITLDGLRRALEPALNRDSHSENAAAVRKVTTQVRAMLARLKDLEPKTASLSTMVQRIEQAYEAADKLPTDLEALDEAQRKVADALNKVTADQGKIADIRTDAETADGKLKGSLEEAAAVLSRCETAYSSATSVGLAAAFAERSKALNWSMWLWVVGLIGALVAGGFFGTHQLNSLSDLVKAPDVSGAAIGLNMLLSLLSVAAPVWFAWLATKQISQRFRLAEDYAFKASVSRAYEGYRREASRIDKDMELRLLASALTRLDEEPLRLVPIDNHGSPWHELANSDAVKQAMSVVPGFARQVKELAEKAISRTASRKPPADPESA